MDLTFLWQIPEWLMEAIWYLFKLVFDTIYEAAIDMIIGIFDWAAPATGVSGQDVVFWVELGNYWFPIDHCYVAMSVTSSFMLFFAATKICIKLIPGVG